MSDEQTIKDAAAEIAESLTDFLDATLVEEILRKFFPPIDEKGLEEIANQCVYEVHRIFGTGDPEGRRQIEAGKLVLSYLRLAVRQQEAKYRKLVELVERESTYPHWEEKPRSEIWRKVLKWIREAALADIKQPAAEACVECSESGGMHKAECVLDDEDEDVAWGGREPEELRDN